MNPWAGLKNTEYQFKAGGVGSQQYDAFGNVVSSTGWTASPNGYGGPFGYQEDPDSGLKLLGHRYYAPDLGRFLSRDPGRDGRNSFAYCENNPLMNADPTGKYLVPMPPGWKDYLPKEHILVPPAPHGSSLRRDIDWIARHSDLFKWASMGSMYRPGGTWDFKVRSGPKYRAYGNFHYGAMMAAAGFTLDDAMFWAGVVEYYDGDPRDPGDGTPRGGFPYGEDIMGTLYWIRMGWHYYHRFIADSKDLDLGFGGRG